MIYSDINLTKIVIFRFDLRDSSNSHKENKFLKYFLAVTISRKSLWMQLGYNGSISGINSTSNCKILSTPGAGNSLFVFIYYNPGPYLHRLFSVN